MSWFRGLTFALMSTLAWSAAMAQEPAVEPPARQADEALLPASEVREDLDDLYEALQQASVDLYAYRSRADYDAFYHGLRHSVKAPLSRLDAAVLYQRLAAFARIGHIRTSAPIAEVLKAIGNGANFAPIFIRVEPNGQVILTDTADIDGKAPAGAQLLAVEGEPVARILRRMRDHVSAERSYMANTVLEEFFPALLWIEHQGKDTLAVELLVDGKRREAQIPTTNFDGLGAISQKAATPAPTTDFNAREFRMLSDTVGYLRPGPFSAVSGEEPVQGRSEAAFVAFIDASFAQLIKSGASDLVLDLRNNAGGDISFSDPMIAWFADTPFRFASRFTLRASPQAKAHYAKVAGPEAQISPSLARLAANEGAQPNGVLYPYRIDIVQPRDSERFEGRVWALINRHSYSNATSVAAIIKDYEFGTLLGEETADVPTSFASIFQHTLDHTGFTFDLAKSYFVRPSGEETVRGVIPDIALPRQEIGSGEDTMLAAALQRIKGAD